MFAQGIFACKQALFQVGFSLLDNSIGAQKLGQNDKIHFKVSGEKILGFSKVENFPKIVQILKTAWKLSNVRVGKGFHSFKIKEIWPFERVAQKLAIFLSFFSDNFFPKSHKK